MNARAIYRDYLARRAARAAPGVVASVAGDEPPDLASMTRDELAALVVVLAEVAAYEPARLAAVVAAIDDGEPLDPFKEAELILPDPGDEGYEFYREARLEFGADGAHDQPAAVAGQEPQRPERNAA